MHACMYVKIFTYNIILGLLIAHRLAADDKAFKQQRVANVEHYKHALAEQVFFVLCRSIQASNL